MAAAVKARGVEAGPQTGQFAQRFVVDRTVTDPSAMVAPLTEAFVPGQPESASVPTNSVRLPARRPVGR